MQRYIFLGLILLISWLTLTQGQGFAGQASCNRISNVEIRYKDYFSDYLGLILLISWLTLTQGQGFAGQASCNRISNVEIRYKDYYPNYLGFNLATQSVDTRGMFYKYIKLAVNECCHFMNVSFKKLNRTDLEVEDLALVALDENLGTPPRPFVFYFPEFTVNNDKVVYDY